MPLSPAEKQARYRERQKQSGNAEGPPDGNEEADLVTEEAVTGSGPVTGLSEAEEQAIRDRFGYAASETRTKAERDAVAARITGRTKLISLDDYVRQALARDDLFDRARAERYARWRYQSFLDGEVASL